MRVFNFSAGPSTLPQEVLEIAKEQLLDWQGKGMSVMEMSHRSDEFMSIATQAEQDLRDLMEIPDHYKVLFLQGGASLQFSMVPMNLLRGKTTADYLLTGIWGKKAISEAKNFCQVNVVAGEQLEKFTTIPEPSTWRCNPDAAYFHYTTNETINGVEFKEIPQVGDVTLVTDMSSNILSQPVDVSRYGVIYAGAQKNIGPAGLTVVIIREDLIGHSAEHTSAMMDYATHAQADSLYNTPPAFAWYMAGLVFAWIKKYGGLTAMAERNRRQSNKLYAVLDATEFYQNPVDVAYRSSMNVPFTLINDELNKPFLQGAEKAGLVQLKGHRSVGGMRASIYNAMPDEGVDALIDYMAEFERSNG